MPIGVILNSSVVVIGGIIGTFLGDKLSSEFKEKLNLIFGLCAFAMAISSVVLMQNMPAVVFATLIGTGIGIAIHLGDRIQDGAVLMQKGISRFIKNKSTMSEEDFTRSLITIIVLFCVGSTGIYGAIVEGISGDHSILIAKSILDLFTAMIFACSLGAVVVVIAIPQFIIFMALFLLARVIFPLTTPAMINDFKACGGILLLATGFRLCGLKNFPTADMIPAMVLAMPVSWAWTEFIVPLVS